MKKLSNIGLTALAGSLVAVTSVANAGELTVNGQAKLSWTGKGGQGNAANTGSPFGMQHGISFSGSGELDNGFTVSLYHDLEVDGNDGSTSALTIDMGSMGVLTYQQDGGNIGIAKVDNIVPTAHEEVSNGNSGTAAASGSMDHEADMGGNGFNYAYSFDMGSIEFGYSRGNTDDYVDDGGTSGDDAQAESGKSVHLDLTPMDGLRLVVGTGNDGVVDQDTFAATYSMGPISVGAQRTDREDTTIDNTEETYASIAFAVNENLSVSYGIIETDFAAATLDQEQKGISIGYSMGGITINAHQNKIDDSDGSATDEVEHTEIEVSFAF